MRMPGKQRETNTKTGQCPAPQDARGPWSPPPLRKGAENTAALENSQTRLIRRQQYLYGESLIPLPMEHPREEQLRSLNNLSTSLDRGGVRNGPPQEATQMSFQGW